MSRITELSDEKRKGVEAFQKFDIAQYTNMTFGMFGGEMETVTLKLPESMIGIILDRFGRETDVRKLENEMVSVRIKAALSGQFYGWLTGLGSQVSILAPEYVRKEYVQFIEKIASNYRDEDK